MKAALILCCLVALAAFANAEDCVTGSACDPNSGQLHVNEFGVDYCCDPSFHSIQASGSISGGQITVTCTCV